MLGGIISKPWSYQIVLIFPITLYSLFFQVSKLHILIDSVTASYEKFFFGDIGRETYEFFWSDFADWYLHLTSQQTSTRFLNLADWLVFTLYS